MEFTVIVNFDDDTVSTLNTGKYTLIYFISSSSNSASSAIPVCCGLVDKFLASLKITFQDDKLFAYVSSSPLNDREEIYIAQPLLERLAEPIATSVSKPISLGQKFTLKSDGTVSIKNDSTASNNIKMQNETNDKYTAGIGLVVNFNCNSLPYRGINAQNFYQTSPLQLALGSKILLAIMPNNSTKINMAVISLNQPSIVIDFSQSQLPGHITYSLKEGWKSDDSRVTKYESDQCIRSILIKPL